MRQVAGVVSTLAFAVCSSTCEASRLHTRLAVQYHSPSYLLQVYSGAAQSWPSTPRATVRIWVSKALFSKVTV